MLCLILLFWSYKILYCALRINQFKFKEIRHSFTRWSIQTANLMSNRIWSNDNGQILYCIWQRISKGPVVSYECAYYTTLLMLTAYERYNVSNHQQFDCFFTITLFTLTTRKTSKLHIIGTGDRCSPHKSQEFDKFLHVITSSWDMRSKSYISIFKYVSKRCRHCACSYVATNGTDYQLKYLIRKSRDYVYGILQCKLLSKYFSMEDYW